VPLINSEYSSARARYPGERAYSVVRTMRQAGKGGAFDRRRALDPSGAPELQLHRDAQDTTDTP